MKIDRLYSKTFVLTNYTFEIRILCWSESLLVRRTIIMVNDTLWYCRLERVHVDREFSTSSAEVWTFYANGGDVGANIGNLKLSRRATSYRTPTRTSWRTTRAATSLSTGRHLVEWNLLGGWKENKRNDFGLLVSIKKWLQTGICMDQVTCDFNDICQTKVAACSS